jgi:hypothetical protein
MTIHTTGWRFSLMLRVPSSVNLFQKGVCKLRNVHRNSLSAQRRSEKETSRKMCTKPLASSARERTCTSVVCGQEVPCQGQCDGFAASAILPRLVTQNFLFPWLICDLKGQRFSSAEEVTPNTTGTLAVIKKWFPGMHPKTLHTLAKVRHFQGNIV